MIAIAVFIGYVLTNSNTVFDYSILYGILTGVFINSAIMITNDIADVEIDRVNNVKRPLVTGSINKREAYLMAIIIALLGILTSILTGIITFAIAFSFLILGLLYNYKLKGIPLVGNLAVSASVAIPFVYGGVISGGYLDLKVFLLSISAFAINTYREIIKDVIDVEGDKTQNLKTLPILIGNKALYIAYLFLVIGLTAGATPLLIEVGVERYVYGILILLAEAILIYSAYLSRKCEKKHILKAKNIALVGMLTGMLAFLFSSII